ncbi:hypothetical protein J3R82DRAFT_5093 [Butyriboletus roseoflavus]|nr:hypothetical protein J3R82DRAFT_5093 [Butyriboletus roseoflavus]
MYREPGRCSDKQATSVFYENIMDERGCLDYTHAALTLNKAMVMKRLAGVPLDQRILYVMRSCFS